MGSEMCIRDRFKGGKGVYILFTSLMFLSPANWLWVLLIPLFSKVFRLDSAPIVLVSLLLILVFYRNDPSSLIISCLIIAVVIGKRLFSHRVSLSPRQTVMTLINRLVYDRDNKRKG